MNRVSASYTALLLVVLPACGEATAPRFESTCRAFDPLSPEANGGWGGALVVVAGAGGQALGSAGVSGTLTSGAGPVLPPEPEPERVPSNDYVGDLTIAVHDRVRTVLEVTWNQLQLADEVWLEFRHGGGAAQRSRPLAGSPGPHRDVVLGVPGDTDVSVRVVSRVGATAYEANAQVGRTGTVPSGMPRPVILSHLPELASSARWLFGAVEDSFGGTPDAYYASTFWLYVIDRQGNIVWYYADPASNATTSFQRRARDGEYIVLEKRCFGCRGYEESVVKMTLDWQYFEEIPVADLADCIDVTSDGSVLYDAHHELWELLASGEHRYIWSCRKHFGAGFDCYSNTVNWDPQRNTVLLSYPYENVVVEIDRATGDLVGQYGRRAGSFAFAPPRRAPPDQWGFAFQHFPNLTATGSLLVSTHMPGCGPRQKPMDHLHAFVEFGIDREREMLVERWRYTEGPEWPRAKGMAVRLPGGNTLVNYGTGGVIREVTPDGRTAWHVKFDVDEGDDYYNKMVGNNELIDDLYALNGGPVAAP